MNEEFVPYTDGKTSLEGFVAYPSQKKSPCVILCHAWKGRDEFICDQARQIASWGYVGFAIDMYGKGVIGKSKEENAALKKPFLDDRHLLQRRILKGFEAAQDLTGANKIAVVGFGFGGLCALDLARAGVNLLGAISVYGHFEPPPAVLIKPIRAKILLLHGHADPVVPPTELLDFGSELSKAGIDWQAHLYGGAMHAFTTPGANDPASGIMYHPVAAERAQMAIHSFLDEVFVFR
jgi:dienelactone hydrolase